MPLSVLPAFNGADEGSGYQAYSLCPDPDGHSIWAFMIGNGLGGLPDNVPSGPNVQYNIVKIDLNTQQITKTWNNTSLQGYVEGSVFVFFDNAGKIWTSDGAVLNQNDPNNSFTLGKSFGQHTNTAAANYMPLNANHVSWVNWTVSGIEYLAFYAPNPADSFITVVNLTTGSGSVVGNFWTRDRLGHFSDPAFNGSFASLALGDIFVDGSGNLRWVMEEINSGGVGGKSDFAWFFMWSVPSGTKVQPTNGLGFVDPFLNGVTWQKVASSEYNSVGTSISNGADLRAQYLPASNCVLLGKAQTASPRTGFGGDVAILRLSDFSQVAYIPSADPSAMIYAPDSGEDIGAYVFQDNSKRSGISNSDVILPSSGAGGGTDAIGRATLVSPTDLSTIKTFDLNNTILATDPLNVAGFQWCYSWPTDNQLSGGQYIPGDFVTIFSGVDTNIYVAKTTMSYPAATSPASDPTNWTAVTSGSSFPGAAGSVFTYRGVYDATVQYNKNDVVMRTDFNGSTVGRIFTAMATSTGVDPIISGSDFWFPTSNTPWYPWNSPLPNTRASMGGPLAHVLYYESRNAIIWTYDFLGSPVYMLTSNFCGGMSSQVVGNPLI